jgi:hypothetical protein
MTKKLRVASKSEKLPVRVTAMANFIATKHEFESEAGYRHQLPVFKDYRVLSLAP